MIRSNWPIFSRHSSIFRWPTKQAILEELDLRKRVRAVQTNTSARSSKSRRFNRRLQKDVQSQFSDAQRKAYLRGQLKAIQRELGEGDTGAEEQIAASANELEEAKPPAEVLAQAERELKRLDIIPPASPEYSVIVGYVETIAELPWSKLSEDNLDLDKAQEILDRDHYDLEKVKRRLIEYLAVRKLNPTRSGTDSLFSRTAGCRQDKPRPIHRRCARAKVCRA